VVRAQDKVSQLGVAAVRQNKKVSKRSHIESVPLSRLRRVPLFSQPTGGGSNLLRIVVLAMPVQSCCECGVWFVVLLCCVVLWSWLPWRRLKLKVKSSHNH
jgi:hypothetical protein